MCSPSLQHTHARQTESRRLVSCRGRSSRAGHEALLRPMRPTYGRVSRVAKALTKSRSEPRFVDIDKRIDSCSGRAKREARTTDERVENGGLFGQGGID